MKRKHGIDSKSSYMQKRTGDIFKGSRILLNNFGESSFDEKLQDHLIINDRSSEENRLC